MPTYQFEAMDATGQEIRDEVEAPTQEEAQATIRQMGYFVTKISVKKGEPSTAAGRRTACWAGSSPAARGTVIRALSGGADMSPSALAGA